MHDLNRNLFYKTSFEIEATEKDSEALWHLVSSIRYWVLGKCKRGDIPFPTSNEEWSSFKTGGRLESADQDKSVVLHSESFWHDEDTSYWACSVIEKKRMQKHALREWVTEIGFSFIERCKGTVYIVLSYADRPGYLGDLQPTPNPTIPGLVKDILGNNNLTASVLGQPMGKSYGPTLLHVGDFPKFWQLVSKPDRDIPVIYVSPRFTNDKPEFLLDPHQITDILGPSALVFCSYDKDYCSEMAYNMPNPELRCSGGTVRVYASKPNFQNPKDFSRHRFFTPQVVDELGVDAILSMFRRAYAQDVFFYESMVRNETVRRMRTMEVLNKRHQERVKEAEDQGIELAESLEDDLLASGNENQGLREELDSLRNENYSLSLQVENYEQAFRATNTMEYDLSIGSWPLSTKEIMNLMKIAFPERLDYTERALQSFSNCGTRAEILWNAMVDLCTIAYDLFTAEESINFAKEFSNKSVFELARCAGSMTRKDAKLMEGYMDSYQGRDLNVEMHLKKGNKEKDDTFLRVYFGFDKESNKIVVSYIGKHLDNFSTRSLS